MSEILALSIPILALFIPLIVLSGYFVIQPLVKVLGQLATSQSAAPERERAQRQIAELEARMERMEHLLTRVVDEQQFQRALQDGSLPTQPAEPVPPLPPHS